MNPPGLVANEPLERATAICCRRKGDAEEFFLIRTHGSAWVFPKDRLEERGDCLKGG